MLTNPFLPQALLEEIERHGEKVEECQKFAKQYINAIKVRSPSWQLWLSLPLSLLFLLAMGANAILLITIRMEASLHEPMYYLLSLLSMLDIILCLTVIPKVLAIFWFDLRAIGFPACFLQMYIMNSFLAMESCTFNV